MSLVVTDPAVAGLLANLREAVADRPAHARHLETMECRLQAVALDAVSEDYPGTVLEDAPLRSGVSQRIHDCLVDDLTWIVTCRWGVPRGQSVYPRAYATQRRADARAAARRAETQNSLESLVAIRSKP